MITHDRYLRQLILPEIGLAGQKRIRDAHILVIGAGGLGVPALQYLVGAGIGKITLLDPDRIEETNLHRQPIYGGYVGHAKVSAAATFLRQLNPDVEICAVEEWLTPANAPSLIEGADLVLDCADSFAVSYTLSDICLLSNKALVSSSVIGMEGYVGGFCGTAPSLRAVFPDLPASLMTCDTAGVMGPVVGMFGALQAQMALAIVLGLEPSPLGQLIRFHMCGFRSSDFRFDHAEEPQLPSHNFISAEEVTAADWVVELRDAVEVPTLTFPFAQRLNVTDFGPNGCVPADGQRAVFMCRSGMRAWRAADRLRAYWRGEITLIADASTSSSAK